MMTNTGSPGYYYTQLQELMPNSVIYIDPTRIAASINTNPLTSNSHPPQCIIYPASTAELQNLINYANQIGLNLAITSSTGNHRHGGITSSSNHVLINLSKWQKIDLIDRRNRVCRVQPGVTYGQLLEELEKRRMTLPVPLAPRSGKSVLTAVMDREPCTWPNKQWDTSDPVGSTEFYFGNGELFRTGAAGGPGSINQQRASGGALKFSSGPSQTDFHRIIQGAQGTMGILTWITLRTELKPSVQKTLLASTQQIENLIPFVYDVQRRMLGEQSFILNHTAAAMLMASRDSSGFNKVLFESLSNANPAFLCLQNIAGFECLPQERLDYHLADILAIADKFDLQFEEHIGSISAENLLTKATQTCGEVDWRDRLLGGSLSIFFLTTLDHMPAIQAQFTKTAHRFRLPESIIGIYIQPIVQNHACHVEFIVPVDIRSKTEVKRMREFESQVIGQLIQAGAFFSRPYGSAAELVWEQNPTNHKILKMIKGLFDPNRILQRGKWDL